MNYLIIGLSNFGIAVATRLTRMGHDVMAVDAQMRRVEQHKDDITTTMQLSLTDEQSVKTLPLRDINQVMVTIDDSIGDSILATALLKKAGVKELTATATNEIHKTILESLGVDNIIMPEMYAAELFASASDTTMVKGLYTVSASHQIVEFALPAIYTGLTVEQAEFESKGLKLVAVKRQFSRTNMIGMTSKYYEVADIAEGFSFKENDRILLYGSTEMINRFKKMK